jgi:uncharacterized YccA/Bax inhibitor family protein
MEQRNLLTRSGNPGLNDKTFVGLPRAASADQAMTLQGTINKSFILLLVLMASALWPWSQYMAGDSAVVGSSLLIGAIGGFILALIISFKPTTAPFLAVPYAALEGLAIGGVSAFLERKYPGVAIQAVGLTFGVLAALLFAFTSRLIRVTQRMRAIVVGATGGIALLYFAVQILGYFHVGPGSSFFWNPSALSIGVSLLAIGIASMNLVLDFDLIETGVSQQAPRYMEWYASFGLLVTLVWLYLEFIRLLSNVRQR